MTARVGANRRGGVGIGRSGVPVGLAYAGVVVLLYLPIAILLVFSVNAGTRLSFPLEGFTFDWYAAVLADGALIESARNSLVVATGSATVATLLGTLVAVAVVRYRFRGRTVLLAMSGLPLIVPFVVLAVAFFLLFATLDIPRSLLTVGVAHSVVAIPFATLIVISRMAGLDPALEDAAMDLGADYPTALRRVVAPLLAPTLVSAWLTCFIVSFDEIALAIFLVGGDPTFPVFLYGRLRFAQQLPVLIAMAVLLMIATVTLTLIAQRLRREDAR